MDKKDYLEKELSRLLQWIQVVDSRLGFILTISTAMLGTLSVLAPKMNGWTSLSAVVFSFAVFFLLLSIIFSSVAAFPRTSGPKGSLIFFSGIESRELSQYSAAVNEMSENSYIDDLISQCHVNAQISEKKYNWVRRALASLFISSVPWIVSLFLLYSIR